jgi:hypothetical protein
MITDLPFAAWFSWIVLIVAPRSSAQPHLATT